jgi:ribosomal protein S18 acetylase RimI-like enzyme
MYNLFMLEVNIRSAVISEIKTLQNLNNEVFIDNHKYDSDLKMDWSQSKDGGNKYFTDLLNNSDSICLVAEVNQKIVGYIAAGPKEIGSRNSKYIEIDNMGVNSEYRSSGIGSQLIEKCSQLAKEKGFQKFYVNAYSQNTKAIDFYKRNGFAEIDVSLEKAI